VVNLNFEKKNHKTGQGPVLFLAVDLNLYEMAIIMDF
jgi:hypothetical protein